MLAATFKGNYKTAEEMAQAFIRESILRGIFQPGEKLNQDGIAAALGISHIPLRAGLRQLEADGLLDLKAHHGATVSVLTQAQVQEIYELRELIECQLLDLAMQNMTSEDVAGLQQLARSMDAGEWSSPTDLEPRRAFYRRLYAFADRPRSVRLVEQLREEVGSYLLLHRVDEHAGHTTLVELIARGDQRSARQWLSRHLRKVSAEIQMVLLAPHTAQEHEKGQAG
jgi:DNA-binding GntR family transcriptional regulator